MPNLFRHPTSPASPHFSHKTNKLVILSDSEGSVLRLAQVAISTDYPRVIARHEAISHKTNKLVILSDSEGSIFERACCIPALGRGSASYFSLMKSNQKSSHQIGFFTAQGPCPAKPDRTTGC